MTFTLIDVCRSCGSSSLFPVLDLGEQPLANAYRRPDDTSTEQRFPLGLMCCSTCSLVQLTGTVPPRDLFDHYLYLSSVSTTMVEAMRELARKVARGLRLSSSSLVAEVGSNDGYLLRHYRDLGIPVLGIEPARNVAAIARDHGIPTVAEYLGTASARRITAEYGPAQVVHANNVMAHAPAINDFASGLAELLTGDGVAFVESPYVGRLVEAAEFDTVYHEHVFYFSLTAFDTLVRRHGLVVSDVEPLTVHGGSMRYVLRRADAAVHPAVHDLLARESAAGISKQPYYGDLPGRVEQLGVRNLNLLHSLKRSDARIAAYGAAAKGTVLLNHFGIGHDLVDVVYDRNPCKQGRLVPGVSIPIADPRHLLRDMPTHTMMLTWNLAEEIVVEQAAYLQQGGRFILPVPEPAVL